jgi:hypothetical protein
MRKPLKTVPKFATEADEQAFRESHDSTDYIDWTEAQKVVLPNLKQAITNITLRSPANDRGNASDSGEAYNDKQPP